MNTAHHARRNRPVPPAWDERALANPHATADKAARVEAMFDAIAPTYERVNHVVSLGQDQRWRQRTVAAAGAGPGDVVVDLCCGTGDMVRVFDAAATRPRLILGIDFAAGMLARGDYATMRTPFQLVRADGLRLPLRDGSVDVVSCAFGVRNLQDLEAGLREMRRVLRPGGRAVVLEFAQPENALIRWGHRLYCGWVLPRLAAWISRDRTGAYRYLHQSIQTFERRAAMLARLERCGFVRCTATPMNLGSVVLYRAEK